MTTTTARRRAAATLEATCVLMLQQNWMNQSGVAPIATTFLEMVAPTYVSKRHTSVEKELKDVEARGLRALRLLRRMEQVQEKTAEWVGQGELRRKSWDGYKDAKSPLWEALIRAALLVENTDTAKQLITGLLSIKCEHVHGEGNALDSLLRELLRDVHFSVDHLRWMLHMAEKDSNQLVTRRLGHALVNASDNEKLSEMARFGTE